MDSTTLEFHSRTGHYWNLHECSPLVSLQGSFLLKDVNDLKVNPAEGRNKYFNKTFSFSFK